MLGLSSPYCLKSPRALDQVFSSSLSSSSRTAQQPQLYSLSSTRTRLHYIAVKPILSTTPFPLAVVYCQLRIGKEYLAVCPIRVLSGWEFRGKVLDITLLPLLKLSVGLQPFSRSHLRQCMHFKGSIYTDGEEGVVPQRLHVVFKTVVLTSFRCIIFIIFLLFSVIMLIDPKIVWILQIFKPCI